MAFRVGGKIFAILAYEETPARVNLKCEPSRALELRESFASVIPGLMDHSYQLVVDCLPKKARDSLQKSGPR